MTRRFVGASLESAFVRSSLWVCILCAVACSDQQTNAPELEAAPARFGYSSLWGVDGELWEEAGRLPDFSHAGYSGGSEPPDFPVSVNVRDFGAVGDGLTDDSAAFASALTAAQGGAVFIPPGRYRLRQRLALDRSGLVLRGASAEKTVLYFELPLLDLEGKGPFGGLFGWAWGGGLISAQGKFEEGPVLAQVTAPSKRGDHSLQVASTRELAPGQLVRLAQSESDGSLSLHLHHGQALEGRCWVDRPGFRSIDWVFRIERLETDRIHFDRPLRVDVHPVWQPEILAFRPTLEEVGVERLKIEFPPTEYNGHHNEPGYNAIYFSDVYNSWVRDVEIENFDTAISFWHTRYTSASGLRFTGRGGHYGLNLGASQDSWVTGFEFENSSLHDLSVSNLANGNVFANGKGININFDHHRGAAYDNLFSNIEVGDSWRGQRLWASSNTPTGHYTAARETFWNIRPRISTKWIPAWPQMNIIGRVLQRDTETTVLDDLWIEPVRRLRPPDLHQAQRRRRSIEERGSGCT